MWTRANAVREHGGENALLKMARGHGCCTLRAAAAVYCCTYVGLYRRYQVPPTGTCTAAAAAAAAVLRTAGRGLEAGCWPLVEASTVLSYC